jgi:hypothetical protein
VFYYKKWFQAGLWYVSDLYDNNTIVTFIEWTKNKGLKQGDYLQWRGIVSAIPHQMKTTLNGIKIQNDCNKKLLDTLMSRNTKSIYFTLQKGQYKNLPPLSDLVLKNYDVNVENFPKACQLYRFATKVPALRELQHKIINKYLPTNVWLLKVNYRDDDDLCDLCKNASETIDHFLWSCAITQTFWKKIKQWLQTNYNKNDVLNKQVVLSGKTTENYHNLYNSLLLLGKCLIFQSKSNHNLNCTCYTSLVTYHYNLYREIHCRNEIQKFLKRWEHFNL